MLLVLIRCEFYISKLCEMYEYPFEDSLANPLYG